jgi:drug/metabolite transporter (DMT)-like permease
MSRRQVLMLLGLSAIWGSSFMFIKVGVRELEPSTLVAGRLLLAALTLVAIVLSQTPLRTAVAQIRAHIGPFVFVALLNSVVPFWLLAWGRRESTPASRRCCKPARRSSPRSWRCSSSGASA